MEIEDIDFSGVELDNWNIDAVYYDGKRLNERDYQRIMESIQSD